jgi:hypothetical protein
VRERPWVSSDFNGGGADPNFELDSSGWTRVQNSVLTSGAKTGETRAIFVYFFYLVKKTANRTLGRLE